MCGRYTLKNPARLKFDRPLLARLPPLPPRYNIAPSQEVLVINQPDRELEASLMRWGLIPSRSTEPKGFINSRAETLDTRPSFSESFRSRRCLIPADGFYEWKRSGRTKQPYYFQLRDEAPFAFAGIWDVWKTDAASITSCSIITTEPNELLATIHDRMPVMLTNEAFASWLQADADPRDLQRLLRPFPAAAMKSFPVSLEVNRAQIDEPQLVEPVEVKAELEQGLLF